MIAAPTEEELIVAAQAGDPRAEEQLLRSLEPVVLRLVRDYGFFTAALDRDDYLQVLRLEALRVIRCWRPDLDASLMTYAWNSLWGKCSQQNRDQRPRGYRRTQEDPPPTWSLDMPLCPAGGNDDGDRLLLEVVPDPDTDTARAAAAAVMAERLWALAEEVLSPPLLRTLELSVGRYGPPLLQGEVAACLGRSQMQISRRLRCARALLLADPRCREFVGE